MKLHPNSKIITIRRAINFLERAQGKDAVDYFGEAKMAVGSYWESKNSTKVATGLSFKEQDLLMPYLINMESDERGFRKAVEDYFHEIDTKVPHEGGTKLEIGLEEDNDKPVAKTNLPISISDFIRWRHCIGHPLVALNKEESEGNSLKKFYIFDPTESQKKKTNKTKSQDTAMQAYLSIKSEPLKVDMLLVLLGFDPRSISGTDKADVTSKRQEKLREYATEQPDLFASTAATDHFETKYLIHYMVTTGVLRKLGEKYMDVETKAILGQDLDEVIAFFTDPEKDQEIIAYKARLQEASKKPVVQESKKTILKAQV